MAIDLTVPQQIAEGVLFGGVDACTIHREAVLTTFDEATGAYVLDPGTLVYTGKCAVRDQSTANVGGQGQQGMAPATLGRWLVKIPFGSPDIEVGDIVTITAARDATLPGRRFVVKAVGGGTFRVSRTLAVEQWEPGTRDDWKAP